MDDQPSRRLIGSLIPAVAAMSGEPMPAAITTSSAASSRGDVSMPVILPSVWTSAVTVLERTRAPRRSASASSAFAVATALRRLPPRRAGQNRETHEVGFDACHLLPVNPFDAVAP